MAWFQNKRLQLEHQDTQDSSRVEVIAHKKATKEQINKVKRVNKNLNDLFTVNGFTLKIYLATNSKYPEHLTTQNPGETKQEWDRTE